MIKIVLILGVLGKIGLYSVQVFLCVGWIVWIYKCGIDMIVVVMGVDVIVNGLNLFNYYDWDMIILQIIQQVIVVVKVFGVIVIIFGNVYNFGVQVGFWMEKMLQVFVCCKGEICKVMEEIYCCLGVQMIVLWVGIFIDLDGNGDVLKMVYMKFVKQGKIIVFG